MIDLSEHSAKIHILVKVATVNNLFQLVQWHCLHNFFKELVHHGVIALMLF